MSKQTKKPAHEAVVGAIETTVGLMLSHKEMQEKVGAHSKEEGPTTYMTMLIAALTVLMKVAGEMIIPEDQVAQIQERLRRLKSQLDEEGDFFSEEIIQGLGR